MKLSYMIFMGFLFSFISYRCTEDGNKKIIEVSFDDIGNYELNTFDHLTFKSNSLIEDSLVRSHYLHFEEPVVALLTVGDKRSAIYLAPGYKLKITIENEAIYFKGEGALLNNKLRKLQYLKEKYNSNGLLFQLNYEDYISRIDSLKNDFNRLMAGINEEKNRLLLDDFFTAYILSQNLNFALANFNLYDKEIIIPQDLRTSFDQLPSYSHMLDVGNMDYIIALHLYQDAILGPQIWTEDFGESDSLKNQYISLLFEHISKLPFEQNLKEFFHAKALFSELQSKGLFNNFLRLNEKFRNQYPGSIYIQTIEDFRQELEKRKNMLFPNISLIDINGQEVNFEMFRGKLIYLDIWATWCRPCIKEFPHSSVLQQKFQNENILFVYLSVDSNIAKWKSYLEENKNIQGIHLIEKEAGSVFKSLHLDGVPRYMIIDQEGRIVDAHAPRPSNEKTLKVLKELV